MYWMKFKVNYRFCFPWPCVYQSEVISEGQLNQPLCTAIFFQSSIYLRDQSTSIDCAFPTLSISSSYWPVEWPVRDPAASPSDRPDGGMEVENLGRRTEAIQLSVSQHWPLLETSFGADFDHQCLSYAFFLGWLCCCCLFLLFSYSYCLDLGFTLTFFISFHLGIILGTLCKWKLRLGVSCIICLLGSNGMNTKGVRKVPCLFLKK